MIDYYEEGFLTLQRAIDEGIIDQLKHPANRDNLTVDLLLQRYPYPPYVEDFFVEALQEFLPLILLLSFLVTAPSIVKDIVIEKESRLKVCIICHLKKNNYVIHLIQLASKQLGRVP